MPVLANSIGVFTFDDLIGSIILRTEKLESFNRPGIVGTGMRKTGIRAQPTTLRSIRYVSDRDQAKTTLEAYQALIGADPVVIVQHSKDWGSYTIVGVRQAQLSAVIIQAGTITANPTIGLVCDWSIQG